MSIAPRDAFETAKSYAARVNKVLGTNRFTAVYPQKTTASGSSKTVAQVLSESPYLLDNVTGQKSGVGSGMQTMVYRVVSEEFEKAANDINRAYDNGGNRFLAIANRSGPYELSYVIKDMLTGKTYSEDTLAKTKSAAMAGARASAARKSTNRGFGEIIRRIKNSLRHSDFIDDMLDYCGDISIQDMKKFF